MRDIKIYDILIFKESGYIGMTNGKSYKVADHFRNGGKYWIDVLNDFGEYDNFTDDLFMTPSEYRCNIIDGILE